MPFLILLIHTPIQLHHLVPLPRGYVFGVASFCLQSQNDATMHHATNYADFMHGRCLNKNKQTCIAHDSLIGPLSVQLQRDCNITTKWF